MLLVSKMIWLLRPLSNPLTHPHLHTPSPSHTLILSHPHTHTHLHPIHKPRQRCSYQRRHSPSDPFLTLSHTLTLTLTLIFKHHPLHDPTHTLFKHQGNAARIKDDMKKEGTRMSQYYDSADLKQVTPLRKLANISPL